MLQQECARLIFRHTLMFYTEGRMSVTLKLIQLFGWLRFVRFLLDSCWIRLFRRSFILFNFGRSFGFTIVFK